MTKSARQIALRKLAFFGPAWVSGAPSYTVPKPTVGQAIYDAGAPGSPLSGMERRRFVDGVVDTGINVNAPAKSLLRAGIGALAGNFLANTIGMGPFMRGVMTATGANYGYNH